MLAALGEDDTAVLVYDTRTVATASAPAAEYVTVRDGRITASRFIFDRVSFEQFRRQAPGDA